MATPFFKKARLEFVLPDCPLFVQESMLDENRGKRQNKK